MKNRSKTSSNPTRNGAEFGSSLRSSPGEPGEPLKQDTPMELEFDEERALDRLLDLRTAPQVRNTFLDEVMSRVSQEQTAFSLSKTACRTSDTRPIPRVSWLSAVWHSLGRRIPWALQRVGSFFASIAGDHSRFWSALAGGTAVLLVFGAVWLSTEPGGTVPVNGDELGGLVANSGGVTFGMDALANFDVIHRMNTLVRAEDDALVVALMQ